MKRGGIVDAISQISDDVSRLLEGKNDALFLIRLDLAKTSMSPTWLSSAPSLSWWRSGPARIFVPGKPICWLRLAATRRLSPVMIFSETPSALRLAIVSTMFGLGGSNRTRNPRNVMPVSSLFPTSAVGPISLYAMPRVRNPLLLNSSRCCWICPRARAIPTTAPASLSAVEHASSTFCTAPLVTNKWLAPWSTRMLSRFRGF